MRFLIQARAGQRSIPSGTSSSSGLRPDVTRKPGGGRLAYFAPLTRLDGGPKRAASHPVHRRAIWPRLRRIFGDLPFTPGWKW